MANQDRSVPYDDETTQACLLKDDWLCDSTEDCKEVNEFSRACLESDILFRTRYSRIQCCLRCCLLFWLNRYGLDSNWYYFHQHGIEQGAAELLGKDAKQAHLDDMLLGSNHQATLPFAARRITSAQLQWKHMPREEQALSPVLRFQCGKSCTENDRRQAYEAMWAQARTSKSSTIGPADWIEVHCGDGCGGYGKNNPWGAYRQMALLGVERHLLDHVYSSPVALVTSTDCDLPSTQSEARLLDHPRLKAWYTVNPSISKHPKLKAIPIGVAKLTPWLERFRNEPIELRNDRFHNRSTRVLCCCMSRLNDPKTQFWYKNLNPIHHAAMHNDSLALDVRLSDEFLNEYRGFVGESFGRRRRSVIVQHLGKLYPYECGMKANKQQLKPPDYAAALAHADFVVSPRGKGRACYRTWEAIISGSIPIVDDDLNSPAMQELYSDELPVFRVRRDWQTDVTPEKLEAFIDWARHHANVRKAYLPYWIAQLTLP